MLSVGPTQDSDTVKIPSVIVVTIVETSSVEYSTVFTKAATSFVPLNIPSLRTIGKRPLFALTDGCQPQERSMRKSPRSLQYKFGERNVGPLVQRMSAFMMPYRHKTHPGVAQFLHHDTTGIEVTFW
jgi:hypothetical protein